MMIGPGEAVSDLERSRRAVDLPYRLFCFHHAGGQAGVFGPWRRLLPPDIKMCAVQLPGHGTRIDEPLIEDLSELLAAIEHSLIPLLDRPFAFFGHSMGALLAYELSRRLHARRMAPQLLCVSARRAPHVTTHGEYQGLADLEDDALIDVLGTLGGGTVEALVDPVLRTIALPIVRADFRACDCAPVRNGPPLAVPIVAFSGTNDVAVSHAAVAAWRMHTSGSFMHRVVDGDHLFYRDHAATICQLIDAQWRRETRAPVEANVAT